VRSNQSISKVKKPKKLLLANTRIMSHSLTGSTHIRQAQSTKANGKVVFATAVEQWFGQTRQDMREIGSLIRHVARANSCIPMATFTTVSG
jgi:hypothetical protein